MPPSERAAGLAINDQARSGVVSTVQERLIRAVPIHTFLDFLSVDRRDHSIRCDNKSAQDGRGG
jgi:hypothetical protein